MNYKLAKQLKEAGFPQQHPEDHHLGGYYIDENNNDFYHETGLGDEYYVPTLSELIEACGDRFDSLEKSGDIWWVNSDKEIYVDGGSTNDCLCTSGKTPEEAVAKLWLQLNSK